MRYGIFCVCKPLNYIITKVESEKKTFSFTSALGRIFTQVTSTKEIDSQPILKELRVDSLDKAIQIFQTQYERFSASNFHPIASKIAFCLAYSYKIQENNEKFVLYALKCLSPLYKRELKLNVQGLIFDKFDSIPGLVVQADSMVFTPFNISIGFTKEHFYPSHDIEVIFLGKLFTSLSITVESISLVLTHSIINDQTYEILKEVTFDSTKQFRSVCNVPCHKPGNIAIKAVLLKLKQITIQIPISAYNAFSIHTGFAKSSIMPLDSECKFIIERPDYGIIRTDYPLKIKCTGIPQGAETFYYSITLQSSPDVAKYTNHEDSVHFTKTYNQPPESFEYVLHLQADMKCNMDVQIVWSLCHETVNSTHNDTFSVRFVDSFTIAFKLFNPSRSPLSLKTPPKMVTNQKYILASTFEYNMPPTATIKDVKFIPSEGIQSSPVSFDLPIDMTMSEAFSYVTFLTATNESKSGSIGYFEVQFSLSPHNDEIILYKMDAPCIDILQEVIKVDLEIPSEVNQHEENKAIIKIQNLLEQHIECSFTISENTKFTFNGLTNHAISLNANELNTCELSFIPIETGKTEFPHMEIKYLDNIVWEATPFMFVKFVETKPENH